MAPRHPGSISTVLHASLLGCTSFRRAARVHAGSASLGTSPPAAAIYMRNRDITDCRLIADDADGEDRRNNA